MLPRLQPDEVQRCRSSGLLTRLMYTFGIRCSSQTHWSMGNATILQFISSGDAEFEGTCLVSMCVSIQMLDTHDKWYQSNRLQHAPFVLDLRRHGVQQQLVTLETGSTYFTPDA
ncbi:hypothetical protein SEVIR_9G472050v4 [Setaria viridis]